MPVTRDFVKSLKPGPKKTHYEIILRDMMANDAWAVNIFKEVGVLLTSHPGNRPFLKASLETHKKLGYWTAVVYDNYFDPKNKEITYKQCMPQRDVFDMADTFIIDHHQTFGGVLYPYAFCLYLGLHTLSSFPYVFCSNGDCVLEKPEGFPILLNRFKESGADIYPCGWEENNGRPLLNTTSFIAKSEAIRAMMVHFLKHLIPIDNYEKYTERMGNAESRFHIATEELGLKVLKPEKNPINTQCAEPHGTWYETIGFRHIHGEYNNAFRRKKIPPHPKYIDNRYMTSKVRMIQEYYDEKDPEKKQKLLERWWSII